MYRLKKIITTFLLSIFLLNNIGVLNTIYAEDSNPNEPLISLEDIGFYGDFREIKTNKTQDMKLFFTYSLVDKEGEALVDENGALAQKDASILEDWDTIYLDFDVPANFSGNKKIKDYSIKISDVSYVILSDENDENDENYKVEGEVILKDLIITDGDSFFYKKDLKDFLENNSLSFNHEYKYYYEKLSPTIEWEISQIDDDGTSNIILTGTGQEVYDSEIDNGNYDDEHNYITKFRYYDNYDNTLREGSFFKLNNSYPQYSDYGNNNIFLPKEIIEEDGDYINVLALSEGKRIIDIYDFYGDLIEKSYESVDFLDEDGNIKNPYLYKEEIFGFLEDNCENENGCYTTIDDYEDFIIFGARIKDPKGERKYIPGLSQVKTKESDDSMFSITHGNIDNGLSMEDLIFQRKINYKATSVEDICDKYSGYDGGCYLTPRGISLEITPNKEEVDTEIFACSIEIEDIFTLDLIKQFGHLNDFCKKVSPGERFDSPGNDIYLYGFGEKITQKIRFKVHSNFEFGGV